MSHPILTQRADERPIPYSLITKVASEQFVSGGFKPAVIFGGRSKLTTEGPFLDLLRAFQQELKNSTILTVVGYSFRDDHVNTYVSQWLYQSSEHRIRIVDPGFEKSDVEYVRMLKQLREKRPDRVEVYSDNARAGLVKLYGERTELEAETATTEGPSENRDLAHTE